ncbi:MAG TPA: extracellular solute-binding protein [Candidatus Avipropionibacterium avicola]|uniref:Extracellular solute-binding protein n=1 Tax=Candidatus Avipropionibacterium avicola TaxID=2840701 RepID=A0A9D1KMJ8_9ACTN|nr:extracellular solute-binding protein [Candidatus Avipropionibacterium avicola]
MTADSTPLGLSRRSFCAVGGLATLAVAGCRTAPGEGTGGSGGGGSTAEATLPNHIPFTGVEPDFPAGDNGVPAGFASLPSDPVSSDRVPLPEIEPISMLLQGLAPTTSFDKNKYYQQIAADCGTDFTMSWGGFGEYTDKFQVTVAGGDLPEVMQIVAVPQLDQLLESQFHDLGEFIGGDKVEEYPNLAAVNPEVWKGNVLNGRLWGVTLARPSGSGITVLGRGDLMDELGVEGTPELTNGEDFMELLKQLTVADDDRYAVGSDPQGWMLPILNEMYGAPNTWRRDGDTLVHQWETEEAKAALEQFITIWEAGYLHPLSFSDPANNKTWWDAGTTALYIDGVPGWGTHQRQYPNYDVRGIATPKWDGGGLAIKHLAAAGYPAYSAISKTASEDRVREILGVMDYVASPLGTAEWMTINYGEEGVHYNIEDGAPVATETMQNERFSVGYLGGQASAQLLIPGNRDLVQRQHEYLEAVLPTGEANAVTGFYSETDNGRGASEQRKLLDTQREIMQGRKPLDAWDKAVANWRSTVGDKIRDEYLAAIEAAG